MTFEGAGSFQPPALGNGTFAGRNMHFGIREHVMGSACNGMALAGLRAYGSGFLIFSDYMKPPIRLAAIMELPVIYIFTHDSIGVGEDGPTHQPVEQLIALRSIPGLIVHPPRRRQRSGRSLARRHALHATTPSPSPSAARPSPPWTATKYASGSRHRPRRIHPGRHTRPPRSSSSAPAANSPSCVGAYEALKAEGIPARVVSMPSWELFEQQDQAYQDEILPDSHQGPSRRRTGQRHRLGPLHRPRRRHLIGMHTFGASAPAAALADQVRLHPRKSARSRQTPSPTLTAYSPPPFQGGAGGG